MSSAFRVLYVDKHDDLAENEVTLFNSMVIDVGQDVMLTNLLFE